MSVSSFILQNLVSLLNRAWVLRVLEQDDEKKSESRRLKKIALRKLLLFGTNKGCCLGSSRTHRHVKKTGALKTTWKT